MTQSNTPFVSVILSGGAGTRLWPASRESHPKPFMKLADGETLIQKTYARAKALGSEVLTVTNRDYYFMSRDEQERVGVSGSFLLEPFGRNTAPAIALAARLIGLITVNLGTGRGYSVLEMIKAFEKASEKSVAFEVINRRPVDITACYADPVKAKELLRWEAKYDIDRMCADAWRWQSMNLLGFVSEDITAKRH